MAEVSKEGLDGRDLWVPARADRRWWPLGARVLEGVLGKGTFDGRGDGDDRSRLCQSRGMRLRHKNR